MTTGIEMQPLAWDWIWLRQANPLLVKDGKAQKGLFRVDVRQAAGLRAGGGIGKHREPRRQREAG